MNDYDFLTFSEKELHFYGKTKPVISSLQPFTQYAIVVQAYNQYGAGPLTKPVFTTTKEGGKSSCVILLNLKVFF